MSAVSPSWGLAQAAAETRMLAKQSNRFGHVSVTQGHRIGFDDGVAYAGPSWVTITPAQQLEHIESCAVCIFCESGRAWGRCVSCGDVKEALPPLGLSRCCGSPVTFATEVS